MVSPNGKDPLPKDEFWGWVRDVFEPFLNNDFHGLKEDVSEMKGKLSIICALLVASFALLLGILFNNLF